MDATPACWSNCSCSLNASAGVFQPSILTLGINHGEQVAVDRRPGLAGLALATVMGSDDSRGRAQPPHSILRGDDADVVKFVGQEPVAQRGVVGMNLMQHLDDVGILDIALADRFLQPLVVPLGREPQDPARHRDRHPDTGVGRGHLMDEREDCFPGRFAWERYAAARRRTSFSCSSNRLRFFNARISARSASLTPERWPFSMSAFFIQLCRQPSPDPEVLRDLFQRSLTLTGHCHDIVAELLRVWLGHDRHPSSEDKSSQVRCQPESGQTPRRM